MARSLHSARLKLDRAWEHIDAVENVVERWLETDAYTISREVHPETGDTVRRAQITERPPDRISILAGDAVQNLRATLDHAVYQLAESQLGSLSPAAEESLMFPIAGNQNSKGQPANGGDIFKGALARGRLAGVPDAAIAFIEQEQPYHWDDGYVYHWVWVVHELSRIDKHRRLAVATAFLDFQYVSTPEGIEPRIKFSHAEGPVKDGDVLVTYSGAEVGVDAFFSRGVALDEGTSAASGIARHLRNLHQRIEWIVRVLEGFL